MSDHDSVQDGSEAPQQKPFNFIKLSRRHHALRSSEFNISLRMRGSWVEDQVSFFFCHPLSLVTSCAVSVAVSFSCGLWKVSNDVKMYVKWLILVHRAVAADYSNGWCWFSILMCKIYMSVIWWHFLSVNSHTGTSEESQWSEVTGVSSHFKGWFELVVCESVCMCVWACVCERLRDDLYSALNLIEQHSADWSLGASADVNWD